MKNRPLLRFPNGAEFAFTILDDTDDSRIANTAPLYALLSKLGMRTTKTVWSYAVPQERQGPYFAAETLDDIPYLNWIRGLQELGYEIAFHNASMGSCTREETIQGLDTFKRKLGIEPRLHCNHGQNRENLYWGRERFRSTPLRLIASLSSRVLEGVPYEGHLEGSEYFWGDIAKRQFKYVRSFAFSSLKLDSLRVPMLYRDTSTPWVNSWFLTADAPDASAFVRLLNKKAIDHLRRSGSYVIVSTHIGKGFVNRKGEVLPEVSDILQTLAGLNGWFVPASTILDHVALSGIPEISFRQQLSLEIQHVVDRIRTHRTQRS